MQTRSAVNDGGILNFWRAYLIRAIRDIDEEFYRAGAEAFILDDDERVLGFRWVCDVLGIDAGVARRKIMDPRLRRLITHGNSRILRHAA
jgi:hypothetical protein